MLLILFVVFGFLCLGFITAMGVIGVDVMLHGVPKKGDPKQ